MILAKKNSYYIRFIKWLQPLSFMKDNQVIFEDEPVTKNGLFCWSPHGIYSLAIQFHSITHPFFERHNILLSARTPLYLPFIGISSKWYGLHPANPVNFNQYMKNQQNISLVVGGFEECSLTEFGKDQVYQNERKGFIKYALKYGYKVYPVYTFNENQLFYTFNWIPKPIVLLASRFKIPLVLMCSKYGPSWPNDQFALITVVGKAIALPQIANPSQEEIDRYHSIYKQKLQELYQKYSDQYNYNKQNKTLIFLPKPKM